MYYGCYLYPISLIYTLQEGANQRVPDELMELAMKVSKVYLKS